MSDSPRWLSDTEQRMWRTYQTMHHRLSRALERDLVQTAGLSMADFAILVPLSEAPGRRLRARDLGQFLDWDRSRLSHQIRRMEQRELVVRRTCSTDARGTFVELTDAGWKTIESAAPAHVEAVRSYFLDALSEADISALHDIATRVSARLAAAGPNAPSCGGSDAG